MANKRDYYTVLGINRNATPDEIKRAFRKLAMQYHPDRNKAADAEQKFKEINEAYEVLSTPEKKQLYDQYGHEGTNPNFGGANPFGGGGFEDIFSQMFGGGGRSSNMHFSFDDNDGGGFEDIFSQMFGGGRKTTSTNQRTNPSQYPLNIESEITISFLESILGADKKIKYHVKKPCPHCHGTGANTPDAVKTCPRCNGSGYVRIRQRTPIGIMESQGICSECHGTGKVITDYCKVCGGNKYIETEEVISIDIPSGISNGERFKISGKGNVGKNGPGDLIIKIFINPSKVFSRKNNTVYANAIVDPILAITGGKIKIPTPYGIKEIELKANTANGEEITVSEMGIRNSNKKLLKNINGDLVITIVYASPKRYSKSDLDVLRSINNGTNQEVEKFVETIRKELEK